MATPTPMADQTPVVGYRFHPTDEELIIDYLEPKNRGHDDGDRTIAVVDVCKTEPWDLPALSKIKSKDQVWFFLSTRHKNKKGKRTTKEGFWKLDGNPRPIKARRTKRLIGTKRTLVFHYGRFSKGTRTKWVMHEYELPQQEEFVLYKLKNKSNKKYGRVDAIQVALPDEMIRIDVQKPISIGFQKPVNTISIDFQKPVQKPVNTISIDFQKPVNTISIDFQKPVQKPVNTISIDFQKLLQKPVNTISIDIQKSRHLVYDKYQDASFINQVSLHEVHKQTVTTSDLVDDGSDLNFPNCPSKNQLLSGTLAIATHEIDEFNNLMPSYHEYQNLDKQDGISASVEGEGSPSMGVPSTDFGMQNQNENSDISSPDGLMISDLESKDEQEVIPDLYAKLLSMLDEEEETENSPLWMPTCPQQAPYRLLYQVEQDFANCLLPQRP